MIGHRCRVEPLAPEPHARDLFDAYAADKEARTWTYMPYGPFGTLSEFEGWIEDVCQGEDPLFHAIVDSGTGKAAGLASYLRIDPAVGLIEVGNISYSPQLKRTSIATEAMYLMMTRVFDELGYRRYEWKCDALNADSKRAAERLGFTFEGVFRQATLYKGRNRDTAWYSLIDREWPSTKRAFERWLDPANFDRSGNQREALSTLMTQRPDGPLQREP